MRWEPSKAATEARELLRRLYSQVDCQDVHCGVFEAQVIQNRKMNKNTKVKDFLRMLTEEMPITSAEN
jgi:hypothetical protein